MSQTDTLVKLEESVFEVKAKNTVLEGKTSSLQSNVQELTTKVDTTDQKVSNLATNAQSALKAIVDQNLALEQTVISLGKLLTAFTKVLVKHKLIEDNEIMAELRAIDEANEKEKMESLKSSGLLVDTTESSEESVLILKHEVSTAQGTVTVSNYRPVQISEVPKEDALRPKLLGLKAGDTFTNEVELKDGKKETSSFTVLNVYNFKNSSESK
jgi:hypothetical protein